MPSPNRFASSITKLDDLPSDGGAVAVLASRLRRAFFRVARLEQTTEFIIVRLEQLERAPGKTTTAKSDISRTLNRSSRAAPKSGRLSV